MDPVEAKTIKEVIAKAVTDPAKLAEVNTVIDATLANPVAEPAAEVTEADTKKMPWLKPRLDRARETERKKVLEEIGVTDIPAVKEIVTKHKAGIDAGKTTEEKLKTAEAERDRYKAENDRHATATKSRLESLTKGLSEEQKQLIPTLPDLDKVAWLESAISRGIFGKPKDAGGGSGGPSDKGNAGGEVKFDTIPDTAPGVVVKDGNKFISRKWIASLRPGEYLKYEKDIDSAMKAGRLVP